MKIGIPYGKKELLIDLPEEKVAGVLRGRSYVAEEGEEALVRNSMASPIGSPKLSELAKGKKHIVVIASDHTRPVPSKIIMPQILAQLREGSPQAEIVILIATGGHRDTSKKELEEKFGREIVNRENIVIHDCQDEQNLTMIGTLPSGGQLKIHKLAAKADLLVAEGFIEPHFFAGFSGGRKSVLPGIASRTCIHYNHNSAFIDHPCARAGILKGNPIHEDMIYAAKAAKLAYIVNVVLNEKKQIIASFAGDCEKAHLAGTEFVRTLASCDPIMSDVVIVTNNGYPLDQDLYQMVKGMSTAEATCREGGVIIAVGECSAGIGGNGFYESFRDCKDIPGLLDSFRQIPPEKTVVDQWQSQILARILAHHSVILISDLDEKIVRDFQMIPAESVEQALGIAERLLKKEDYTIAVIPEGISVIIGSDSPKERK